MGAFPKAPVNMDFFLFFFSLFWEMGFKSSSCNSVSFTGNCRAGGQEAAGKRCSAHSPGAEDMPLGRHRCLKWRLYTHGGGRISGPGMPTHPCYSPACL